MLSLTQNDPDDA